MKVRNTKDIEDNFLKALFYGPSGSGKTSLVKGITKIYKTLIISAESGLLSVAGLDCDVIDITTDDSGALIEDKKARLQRLADIYSNLLKDKRYELIFIDSLSELSQTMVEALQKEMPDRKDSLVLWGENLKRMRALIKAFRDLKKHVIMTCLSDVEKDETGKRYLTIDMAGKISKEAPAMFDLVAYLNVDAEGKRTLITQPSESKIAKDRSGLLDPIEPADLSVIMQKIFLVKEKEEPKQTPIKESK